MRVDHAGHLRQQLLNARLDAGGAGVVQREHRSAREQEAHGLGFPVILREQQGALAHPVAVLDQFGMSGQLAFQISLVA